MLQLLELVKGEDARFDIPVLIDGVKPAGAIDDWSFEFRLFASRDDADTAALLTLTSAGGAIAIFNSDERLARVTIRAEAIVDREPGKYYFRLTTVQGNGDRDVLTRGSVKITR